MYPGSRYNRIALIFTAVIIVAGGFFVFQKNAQAAPGIYKTINFQGKVVNTDGTNVANGNYDFVFKIYTVSSGSSPVWTENRTGGNQVTVNDGIFQVNLGSITALPGSVDFNTDNIYLGIEFNSNGEMTPRVQFTASPYAFQADNSNTLQGSTWGSPGAIGATTPNSASFTTLNSSGASQIATAGGAVGIGNTAGTATITSGGTSSWANTSGNLTVSTVTSGTLALSSAGALNLSGSGASYFNTSSGNISFQVAGTGTIGTLQIGVGGAGSTAPDYLGLDVKSTTGDPAGGFEGAMYYNTSDNKFRCYQGTDWTDCIGGTGSGMSNPMTTSGDIIYGGASGSPLALAGSTVDGYVLKYNTSTSAPYWSTDLQGAGSVGIGTTVAGATAGSVFFAGTDGILQQDNANFFWNDSTNRLGIGTTNPGVTYGSLLHLYKNDTTSSNLLIENAGNGANSYAEFILKSDSGVADFFKNSSTNNQYGGTGSLNFGTISAENVGIITNNSLKVLISSGGNVGIGKTNPGYKLDVNGTLGVGSTAYFASNVGIGTSVPNAQLDVTGTGTQLRLTNSGTNYNTFSTDSNGDLQTISNSGGFNFVGAQGGANEKNFIVTSSVGGSLTNAEFSALTHLGTEMGTAAWTALYAQAGSANYAGVFNGDVWVSGNGKITGNLGVGTTNPTYGLDLVGTFRMSTTAPVFGTSTITIPNANGTMALTSDLHNAVTLGTANGLSLATQQLSLGTASSTTTGALTSGDWTTFNGKQAGSSNLTSLSGLSYVSNAFVKMTAANTFSLDTTTYLSDGSVYALLAGRAGGQTLIGGTAADNTLVLQGNGASSGNTATSANLTFKTGNSGGTTAMTILNNGKIGVGDATPAELFTVGSGDLFNVNSNGDVISNFTALDGTDTTSAGGTNSTSLVLTDETGFDVGNYVQVNSNSCRSGINICYAKITAINTGTNTLTITPQLSWANGSTINEYHIPEIGATNTASTLTNRYGRGYFIGGTVSGNASTYYSDGHVYTSDQDGNDSIDMEITTGNTTTSGNSGDVRIDTGSAATTAGLVLLGNTNASGVTIGSGSNAFTVNTDTVNDTINIEQGTYDSILSFTQPGAATQTYTFATGGTVTTLGNATTGTGNIVRDSSPVLVTPTLGVAAATSINKVAITAPVTSATLTIADGKTLTASNTLTFQGTDGSTLNIGAGGTLGSGAYATISNYATLADPTFTGDPKAPTAVNGDNDTSIATTAFVKNQNYLTSYTETQQLFSNFAVSGQSNVVADGTSDTVTLIAGTNVTITTNATNDEITINSTGGGGHTQNTDTGTNASTFIVDNDGDAAAADITYQFGNTNSETLKFLGSTTDNFELSDDLIVLGGLTATTINGNTISTGTGTLTLGAGKTLTASNTLTFTGTDGSSVNFGAGGTAAYTGGTLGQFAATTSAQLSGVLSDENTSGGYMTNPMTTAGDLIYAGASGVPARLPASGTDGWVLSYNTSTSAPQWTAAPGGGSLQGAYDGGNTISTANNKGIAFTLSEVGSPQPFSVENQDTNASVAAERIFNSIASGTLAAGLLVEQTGAGTMTDAIKILETAGAITTGLNIGNNVATGISIGTGVTTGISIASGGITITGGALAINNATGITSNQATMIINAGGTVDVQDTLNVDALTTDTSGVTIASGQSYTGTGAVTLSSATGTGLTIDSGSTGSINMGTSANAKTITIGNATGATTVNINSGTGGITLAAAGDSTGTIQIGIGGAGTTAPDVLGLAVKSNTGDPAGFEGAMYYNTADNKFRCYQGAAWTDCIGSGTGGSPGGVGTNVQYNDGAGGFAGAANVNITTDGNLNLAEYAGDSNPQTPSAGITMFDRKRGGRNLPAFIGPAGMDSSLQPFLGANMVAVSRPRGNATTIDGFGFSNTAGGTATAANVASTNLRTSTKRVMYASTTATGTGCGWVNNTLQYFAGNGTTGVGGYNLVMRFSIAQTQPNWRFIAGMQGLTTTGMGIGNTDPSGAYTNTVAIIKDAADTNFYFYTNDGTLATTNKVSTGIATPSNNSVVAGTTVYELRVFMPPNSSTVYMSFSDLGTGTVVEASYNTQLPTNTTLLTPRLGMGKSGTGAVQVDQVGVYMETDI